MSRMGKVYLVGAGPGDPGLLTLKGLACLREADLVLYDGLVNPLVLAHTRAEAVRTCRAASVEGRQIAQEEINQILVREALAGQVVVRLKGGDPYIFGRGSEEVAAIAAAGIPYEVVPGVTAAIGAAVYAGLSLTHRQFSSAVAFITGHEDPAKTRHAIDYEALTRFPGTLVFYMGLHRLPQIARSLVEAGKPPTTPAIVISRATTPLQRTVQGTLETLPGMVEGAALHAPSLIIVGECVQAREVVPWFEGRPLFGLRVGIARAESQAEDTALRCTALGGFPVLLPTIEIGPPDDWAEVDATLDRIDEYHWLVFTSTNGVQSFFRRAWERGFDLRRFASLKLAAIGAATAEELERFYLRADFVPDEFCSESLAEGLVERARGQRVVWARASRGRDVLPDRLRGAGIDLREVVVYRNQDLVAWSPSQRHPLEVGEVDWVALSSPSIARSFARLWNEMSGGQPQSFRVAAISPITADAAREAGLRVDAVADEFTWEGIFEAITRERHAAIAP